MQRETTSEVGDGWSDVTSGVPQEPLLFTIYVSNPLDAVGNVLFLFADVILNCFQLLI